MGDWTMEGLAFGAILISMASVFVLSAWFWPENGVETSSGSLEGIGSISTLESVSKMATRTTRYSFLLWTKKLAPPYLIWAFYYWKREGLTFCSVNNIATNISLKLYSRTSQMDKGNFWYSRDPFLLAPKGLHHASRVELNFVIFLNLHIVLEAPRKARRNYHCNDRFFVLTWLLRGRQQ